VLQADIRVTTLPAGEDPDSLVRQDPARFRALVDGARPVIDHVFEAASARFDLSEARERSQALDALAPAVAAITDAVVRAHYVQRLARLAQVDERTVLALLGRRTQRRPVPVPDRAEVARKAVRSAAAPDGETQLLQLLLHREEARGVRQSIDEDAFEDSANRRLFLAWREAGQVAEQLADLDEDLQARYAELESMKPEWLDARYLDGRYVEEMALSMATQLRLRRRGARLAPVARQVATQLTAARRGVAAPGAVAVEQVGEETTDDITAEELATELTQMAERQRILAREYREHIRRQPAPAGGERQMGDEADDADF
jgi:DNA primase